MTDNSYINIIKGTYRDLKILNTTFPLLKPVETLKGHATALVDASSVLGSDFKKIIVNLEDYKCL